MSQPTANRLEEWFVQYDSKLPIFGIDPTTAKLLVEAKETDNLGILVKLPEMAGYTEVHLTQEPIPLSQQFKHNRAKLNVFQTINLVLPEFDAGIVPTVSELQELLFEAIAGFVASNYVIVTF